MIFTILYLYKTRNYGYYKIYLLQLSLINLQTFKIKIKARIKELRYM